MPVSKLGSKEENRVQVAGYRLQGTGGVGEAGEAGEEDK